MSAGERIVVTGIGLVSPLGDSPAALHRALIERRDAWEPKEVEDSGTELVAEIADLAPERVLGEGNLRPLDRTGRLATMAAALALGSSGLAVEEPSRVGLALGTQFGGLHTIAAFDRRGMEAGPLYVKPFEFANSVLNAAAGQAAIWHRLAGVNATISCAAASGVAALRYAADALRGGRADAVLAGGAEELAAETLEAFAQAGGSSRGERPRPFDRRRVGAALGEGAALLVLEREEDARSRGVEVLAVLRGSGEAFDPSLGADGGSLAEAVEDAVREALADGGLAPERLAAISAAASGDRVADAAEGEALARVVGDQLETIAITAVKGGIGEALGASGALQTAALIEALREGLLPGIAACEEPDPEIRLRGLGPQSRPLELGTGLVVSTGGGGGHVAVALLEVPR